jgi:HD-GYP domain-containing protein (c-di-GMP phosphodiesterase class II)
MPKQRIRAGELAVGHVLQDNAYDENGRLLLSKGYVIASATQIEALITRGLFIDPDKEALKAPKREPEPLKTSAVSLILDARHHLQLICAPTSSRESFPQHVAHIRNLIKQACSVSEDASIATAMLERQGRYSIRHSLDVAITCQIVGETVGVNEPELTSTICAALTMNLSVLQLQDELQAQKGKLSEPQQALIQAHPAASVAALRERGVTDEIWLSTVLDHHEAADGSGYPSGKKENEISLPAQLVALADVYCARISGRQYRSALRPNAALRALFLDQGKKVRSGFANQFIKAIGIFPAGTPVRLESGEIAIVTSRGTSPKTPVVCAVIGPRGMPLAIPTKRDTANAAFGVREVIDWSELGAVPSMQSLWGKIAAIA